MEKTTYFPLFVDMKDRHVLVFGAGKIAERRIKTLLDFDAQITVVSPDVTDGIINLVSQYERMSVIKTDYEQWRQSADFDSASPFLVLAATNDSVINVNIASECHKRNIIVNVCDDAGSCDFYFPAIARKDEMVVGICGNGKFHNRVRELAARLREFLAELNI